MHAGLLVSGVLPRSPASGAGMHVGDVITAVNGRRIASIGSTTGVSTIRGRAGTRVSLTVRRGARTLTFSLVRRVIATPIVEDAVVSSHGVKLGIIYLPTFDVPGVHGEVGVDLHALLRAHVRGIVLDLRDNRGGLVTEAQLVASMFLRKGVIVTTRARGEPSSVVRATGEVIAPTIPLVVLVNANTASAAEIVTGALHDHHRASDRRHAHLRQGRLPGDHPALQRRRGRYHGRALLPARRREPRRRRAAARARDQAGRDRHRRAGREGRPPAAGGAGDPRRAGALSRDPTAYPAVLERRGRFVAARPLFDRPVPGGRTPAVDPARARAKVGDLVLVAVRPSRRGGRAEIVRRLGRPEIARDVIEALMIDRGLDRSFEEAVEREARAASGEQEGRRDLRDLPTFTIDPASARDFDDAISAERTPRGAIRVWVHIADVAAFVAPGSLVDREAQRRATSVYVPGAVEPMLPAALSNDRCSLRPGEDRFAVSVELEIDGERVVRAAFTRSVIRSDERLDYDRVDRIFAGAERAQEPWSDALAAAREAAAGLGRARMRRGGLEIAATEPEFSFERSGRVRSVRATEQTESHRLIEHLMIAANEQVAQLLAARGEPALYRVHEEPDPERVERLVDQLVSLEVPTPPIPDRIASSAGRRARRCDLAGARALRPLERARRQGVPAADPARAQAGLLLAAQPRSRRSALVGLLPLHLADPPLPGPRLPPRAAEGDRRAASGARPRTWSGNWASGARCASATRPRSSAPPTTSRAASCSSARTPSATGTARSSA